MCMAINWFSAFFLSMSVSELYLIPKLRLCGLLVCSSNLKKAAEYYGPNMRNEFPWVTYS